MAHGGPTKTDPAFDDWAITDEVIRLRAWAEDRAHLLPTETTAEPRELIIGSADGVWLQLDDEQGRVSRRHAALSRAGSRWKFRDLGSKNGTKVDRVRRETAVLEAGNELWIGGVTLVAESARSIALRDLLRRVLGWKAAQAKAVDEALRAVHMAAVQRTAIVLCGDDDLVRLARSLHLRALGPERPFILCDPARKPSAENVRMVTNYQAGLEALRAAAGGTICIRSDRPPRDLTALRSALQERDSRSRLIVCAKDPQAAEAFGAVPIAIPALSERSRGELERIVREYMIDAAVELRLGREAVTDADHAWVLRYAKTLPEIDKACLRLVAIRNAAGNLNRAAAWLGMARMSLYAWAQRRKLRTGASDAG